MGISICNHIYDYKGLIRDIELVVSKLDALPEGRSVKDFVDRVLPEFGIQAGDKFITLWNDYFEDFSSAFELFRAIELYFGVTDVFLYGYDNQYGANAYDVFDELKIEPIEVTEHNF